MSPDPHRHFREEGEHPVPRAPGVYGPASAHFRIVCACGRVIAQCRCPGPKREEVREHPACGHVEPLHDAEESSTVTHLPQEPSREVAAAFYGVASVLGGNPNRARAGLAYLADQPGHVVRALLFYARTGAL